MKKSDRLLQKVEIAKDVIKQLKANRFVATRGTYFSARNVDAMAISAARKARTQRKYEYAPRVDAQKVVKSIKKCDVCARGAVVISAIDKFDKLRLAAYGDPMELLHTEASSGDNGLNDSYINRWFDEEELVGMEQVFERVDMEWSRVYPDSTDRMDAIMRNIIANKGTFDIESIPKPRKNQISQMVRISR